MPPLGTEIDNSSEKWKTYDGRVLNLIFSNNKYLEPELMLSPLHDLEDPQAGFFLQKDIGKCQFIR